MAAATAGSRLGATVTAPVLTAYDGRTPSAVRVGEQLAKLLGLPLHVAIAYRYEPAFTGGDRGLAPDSERRLAAADRALDALSLDDGTGGRACRLTASPASCSHWRPSSERRPSCSARTSTVASPGRSWATPPARWWSPPTIPCFSPIAAGDRRGVRRLAAPSRFALTAAQRLALAAGARLDVVGVGDDARHVEALRRRVDEAAATHAAEARGLVRRGRAADELRRASEHADLLVCGSHNRGALLGAVLGSVSSRLVDDPVCPVVVVPVRARRDAAGPLGSDRRHANVTTDRRSGARREHALAQRRRPGLEDRGERAAGRRCAHPNRPTRLALEHRDESARRSATAPFPRDGAVRPRRLRRRLSPTTVVLASRVPAWTAPQRPPARPGLGQIQERGRQDGWATFEGAGGAGGSPVGAVARRIEASTAVQAATRHSAGLGRRRPARVSNARDHPRCSPTPPDGTEPLNAQQTPCRACWASRRRGRSRARSRRPFALCADGIASRCSNPNHRRSGGRRCAPPRRAWRSQ